MCLLTHPWFLLKLFFFKIKLEHPWTFAMTIIGSYCKAFKKKHFIEKELQSRLFQYFGPWTRFAMFSSSSIFLLFPWKYQDNFVVDAAEPVLLVARVTLDQTRYIYVQNMCRMFCKCCNGLLCVHKGNLAEKPAPHLPPELIIEKG